MVASGQKNLLEERMKICTLLWDARIKVYYHAIIYVIQYMREINYVSGCKCIQRQDRSVDTY